MVALVPQAKSQEYRETVMKNYYDKIRQERGSLPDFDYFFSTEPAMGAARLL